MPGDLAPKATRHQQRVGRRELGTDDAFAVTVDDACNLCEWPRLIGHTVRHFRTLAIEGKQADAIQVGRADQPAVRAETELLYEPSASVRFRDVMCQSGALLRVTAPHNWIGRQVVLVEVGKHADEIARSVMEERIQIQVEASANIVVDLSPDTVQVGHDHVQPTS